MRTAMLAVVVSTLLLHPVVRGAVVVNEVFYNAPDDLEDLQWIELHNSGESPVDLTGWTLDEGRLFEFPKATKLEGGGYLIVALKSEAFARYYQVPALGPLLRPLQRGGERIDLRNANGQRVDSIRYRDREPWPLSADGYSASLERICPGAPGESPANWAGSPLPSGGPGPAGTPGARNTAHSTRLPPLVALVEPPPEVIAPDTPLPVEVEVRSRALPREVLLLYRIVADGQPGDEISVSMTPVPDTRRYRAEIPGQPADRLVRFRIRAVAPDGDTRLVPGEHDLRPTFSTYVHGPWESARIPFGLILHVREPATQPAAPSGRPRTPRPMAWFRGPAAGEDPPRPPRGSEAFVFVDHTTGQARLFDHVNVVERWGGRGYNVFFQKDRRLREMSSIGIIFEGNERFLLAEALAYEVYRKAGNAAPLTDFVRLWVDGHPSGYHLMVERPNRSFLRRNNVNEDGDLYEVIWYGQDIVSRHERKTHAQRGHQDLIDTVQRLNAARGEDQWAAIRAQINVEQVATYFAVNMVLSHWDGFFNNHYMYHDLEGTGRWSIYPWDQDKTWGYYDGIGSNQVFFDMPLTFGMEGDRPPARRGWGGMPMWWRPGGYFSGPLLANERFRRVFLARVREILNRVYTEELFFPLIDRTAERLQDDARLRAELAGRDPQEGARLLARNVESLRNHLRKRRQFLLEQKELSTTASAPAGRP